LDVSAPEEASMVGPKVFCIGFHKTGTTSLAAALERLGYRVAGPFGVRDRAIAEHALGEALARVERYDAFQDNPWPLLYRELDERCPGSRFVLTVRPDNEWIDSVVSHFGGVSTPMREWIYGEGAGDPVGHEQTYLERHRRHVADVQAHFADRPEALLTMDLGRGDSWDELCAFLGTRGRDEPFPHANRNSRPRRVLNRARSSLRRGSRR
jgi:hypothetical protein